MAEVRSVSSMRIEFVVEIGKAFGDGLGGSRLSEVIPTLERSPVQIVNGYTAKKNAPHPCRVLPSPRNITHLWDGQAGFRRPIKAAGDQRTLSPSTCLFPFRGQIAKHEQDRVKSSSMIQISQGFVRSTRASLFPKLSYWLVDGS